MTSIPGAVDVHLAQVNESPELLVDVDRTAAQDVGLTMRDVGSDLLVSLSGSFQTAPNFWMDPKTAVQYSVAVQTPQVRIDSIQAVESTPLMSSTASVVNSGSFATPVLASSTRARAALQRRQRLAHHRSDEHHALQHRADCRRASECRGADLGTVSSAVQKLVAETRAQLPRGSTIKLTGRRKR